MNRTEKLKVPLLDDQTLSPQVAWQDAFNRVEKGMLGEKPISVSGSDQTLVGDDARYQIFTVTGVDQVARTLNFPNGAEFARPHIVRNATTQTLTVKTTAPGSVGVALPAGANQYLYNTGTEIIQFTTGLGDINSINGVPVSPTPLEEGQTYALVGGVLTPVDFPTGGGGGGGGGSQNYVQPNEPPADAPIGTGWYDTDAPSPGGGSGGGSGSIVGPDAPPANPDPMDDEFTGEALDAKWSMANQILPLHVENGRLKSKQVDGNANRLNWISQATPAGDWEFRSKVIMSCKPSTYSIIGLGVFASNGAGMTIQIITFDYFRLEVSRWNSNGVYYDAATWMVNPTSAIGYYSIQKQGADVIFGFSPDGEDYCPIFRVNYAGYFLPDLATIGLCSRPLSENGNVGNIASVEWFRRKS